MHNTNTQIINTLECGLKGVFLYSQRNAYRLMYGKI